MAKTPLQKATEILGGINEVAALCAVSRPAVEQWAKNGVPRQHLLKLERATRKRGTPITVYDFLKAEPVRPKRGPKAEVVEVAA